MSAHAGVKHAFLFMIVALGIGVGALAQPGAAWAHAARIASDPAENAQLSQQPARVNATFNEPMQSQFAAMTVIGPDGAQWSDGDPAVDGPVISVAVRPGGPAGTYTVNYRATSADGHVVTGSWSYQLLPASTPTAAPAAPDAPAAPATTTAASPADDRSADGTPVWPFVAGTTALVAAGAVWAVRRRS
ncbi:protein, copper resistance protein CopC-like protein [Mycolicibacterium aurum]|uniref:Protein, copper resistance protein CopC-like protein n=1 Tax=Mycolicibacterium aurum TaxID=1791 RepID=A0A448J185_MYCAU|nr:copper resistance CopC family protein [Mycolicibacterium aurum]VEG58412.1 protein, copper resistance protein CopC-like protein [Mycolicibacterium aurum]